MVERALEGLSWAEAEFVREYLRTGGDSGAARARAGAKLDPRRHAVVRAAIRQALRAAVEEAGIEARRVVAEVAAVALAPVGDPEVKTREKLRALELLGRHLRIFDERVRIDYEGKEEVRLSLSSLSDSELEQLESVARRVRLPNSNGAGNGVPDHTREPAGS